MPFTSFSEPVRLDVCGHVLCKQCVNTLIMAESFNCDVCKLPFVVELSVCDYGLLEFVKEAKCDEDEEPSPCKRPRRPDVIPESALALEVRATRTRLEADVAAALEVGKKSLEQHACQVEAAKAALDKLQAVRAKEMDVWERGLKKMLEASTSVLDVTFGQIRTLDLAGEQPVVNWKAVKASLPRVDERTVVFDVASAKAGLCLASNMHSSVPSPGNCSFSGQGLRVFASRFQHTMFIACYDAFGHALTGLEEEDIVAHLSGADGPGPVCAARVRDGEQGVAEVVFTCDEEVFPVLTLNVSVRGVKVLANKELVRGCVFGGSRLYSTRFEGPFCVPFISQNWRLEHIIVSTRRRLVCMMSRDGLELKFYSLDGFCVGTFALGVTHIQGICWGPDGSILVGTGGFGAGDFIRVINIAWDGERFNGTLAREIPAPGLSGQIDCAGDKIVYLTRSSVSCHCRVITLDGLFLAELEAQEPWFNCFSAKLYDSLEHGTCVALGIEDGRVLMYTLAGVCLGGISGLPPLHNFIKHYVVGYGSVADMQPFFDFSISHADGTVAVLNYERRCGSVYKQGSGDFIRDFPVETDDECWGSQALRVSGDRFYVLRAGGGVHCFV